MIQIPKKRCQQYKGDSDGKNMTPPKVNGPLPYPELFLEKKKQTVSYNLCNLYYFYNFNGNMYLYPSVFVFFLLSLFLSPS